MAACPNCQTENDADFGLVNCSSCGKAFLVEIDGQVRAAEAAPPANAEESFSASEPVSQVAHQLTNFLLEDLSSSDSVSMSSMPPALEQNASDEFNFSNQEISADAVSAPALAVAARETSGARMQELPSRPKAENLNDMRELASFGNSDASLAREGAYRFNLFIYGIDSSDIRQEVKDALTDGRFLWDLESLLNQIEQGVLKLNDLSAVKSALIVQRLKTLPVDIKWEQYAIHQS